ncbi:hypothetical protein [Caballeronia sp. dw_19]|uniref:hypothetical protein n=1 Tax=Caballeronia sp. dw_19 TaxID=2719791 RepID=UPI001BCB85A1|nr:hypothetical protein [Caballeronia sp. dw_19]
MNDDKQIQIAAEAAAVKHVSALALAIAHCNSGAIDDSLEAQKTELLINFQSAIESIGWDSPETTLIQAKLSVAFERSIESIIGISSNLVRSIRSGR